MKYTTDQFKTQTRVYAEAAVWNELFPKLKVNTFNKDHFLWESMTINKEQDTETFANNNNNDAD